MSDPLSVIRYCNCVYPVLSIKQGQLTILIGFQSDDKWIVPLKLGVVYFPEIIIGLENSIGKFNGSVCIIEIGMKQNFTSINKLKQKVTS